ncbi:hypothetical protein LIG30_2205 [Burkholderia sp. lig30]|jgi:putative methyltransferase (TIGR04325 family)|uniref:hypothetical protein n=1 Tax=Burkholderia sp. lig30 TaxID=1192124 RepID=UPI000460B1EE|nr:hypothetical protein [Burkholderia sp. lig30]KDB08747.1 hypothetical protein LIG30_2205 [Burkholderia sp. lig30]
MPANLISNLISRLSGKRIQQAAGSRLKHELDAEQSSEENLPKQHEIFSSEAEVQAHLGGYQDGSLNEYIIAKSTRWLDGLRVDEFVLPPHLCNLLWVIQVVHSRLGRPVRILDFGGGAPTIAFLMHQLGLSASLDSYRIIESPAFVQKVPAAWRERCEYFDVYDGDACDLLILSSVLPYLNRFLVQSVYRNIEKAPPEFVYFGRTSFLPESYQQEEAFTIQESRYREHGAQIDVGMTDIENNVARYVKRHFKWSEVASVIDPLGYTRILLLSDESGLENIQGLNLYTNNSLWERRG